MGATRTAWHPPFTGLLVERCPRWIRVRAEVQLTTEPLRVDDLLEVWPADTRDLTDTGSTLRGLWPLIVRVGLLEFKSVARPFRRGDLHRLLAYGALWIAGHGSDTGDEPRCVPAELTLILVVPGITSTLVEELSELSAELTPDPNGYHHARIGAWRLVVAELRVVAERERDDLLRLFAGVAHHEVATIRWMRQHFTRRSDAMHETPTPDLEGYDDIVRELLAQLSPEHRLAGLAPEQRLAGLAPEQRLAGLAPEETLLALPDAVLRTLPASYVDGLSPTVRDAIRARLSRAPT